MTDLLTKIAEHAQRRPDAAALVGADDRSISWAELDDRVSRLTAGFAERGRRTGDRILIGIFKGTSALELYLAAQRAALVPVVVGPSAGPDLPMLIAEHRIAEAFVGPELRTAVVSGTRFDVDEAIPAVAYATPSEIDGFVSTRAGGVTSSLQFSTGSTGTPKTITRTVAGDFADAVNRCLAMGVREGDRWLCAAPKNTNVAIGALRCTLLMGGTVVLLDEVNPSAIERQTADGISVMPLQAHDWKTLLESPVAAKLSGRGLRIAVATGGRVDPAIMSRLDDVTVPGGSALNIYGLTEAGSVAISTARSRAQAGRFAVGVPGPLVQVMIDAPEADSPGEVWVRGAAVSIPHGSTDGWLATGDLGTFDRNGNLEIHGRIADQLQVGDDVVHPASIEVQLCDVDGVSEALLLSGAVDHPGVRAVVVADGEIEPASVMAALGQLAERVPVYRMDAFPRNNGGKTDRRAVAALDPAILTLVWEPSGVSA